MVSLIFYIREKYSLYKLISKCIIVFIVTIDVKEKHKINTYYRILYLVLKLINIILPQIIYIV